MSLKESIDFWMELVQEKYQIAKLQQDDRQEELSSKQQSLTKNFAPNTKNGTRPIILIQPHLSKMEDQSQGKHQWTQAEQDRLFEIHRLQGNKWSIIAQQMGLRSENCVKNKFYSTLRKGFRKINKYISNVRRKTHPNQAANNKLLKPDFLTKLSAIADRHYLQKYEVKQIALQISRNLQHKIIFLSRNAKEYDYRQDSENYSLEQELLSEVFEFRKNCKKRKGKRKNIEEESSVEEMQVERQKKHVEKQVIKINVCESKSVDQNPRQKKEQLEESIVFKPPQKLLNDVQSPSDDKGQNAKREFSYQESISFACNQIPSIKSTSVNMNDFSPFSNSFLFGVPYVSNMKKIQLSTRFSQLSDINKCQSLVYVDKISNLGEFNTNGGISFFKSSQLQSLDQSQRYFSEQNGDRQILQSIVLGRSCEDDQNYRQKGSCQIQTPCTTYDMSFRSMKMSEKGKTSIKEIQ